MRVWEEIDTNGTKSRTTWKSRRLNLIPNLQECIKNDLSSYKGTQRKDKIARNLVDYEAGKTILETVLGIYKSNNTNQTELF